MKRLLQSALVMSVIASHVVFAEVISCQPTFQGKPFVQAVIWADMSGFGPAECDYKDKNDTELTVYSFPEHNDYYVVSGNWRSAMPGDKWCDVKDGNTYATCRFALKEKF